MPVTFAVRGPMVLSSAVYAGPEDIVANATAWWGLRAISLADIGLNAIRLRESGGNTEQDFATIAGGGLDLAAIATFKGASNLFVVTLYDQSGGTLHLTQATTANQPAFTLSGLGSLPIITFDGTNDLLASSGTEGVDDIASMSAVANSTNTGAQQSLLFHNKQLGYRNSADNQVFLFDGAVLGATASDGSWHALQAVFNNLSSDMNVDGSVNAGSDGNSGAAGAATFTLGSAGGGQFLNGSFVEGGYWTNTVFSGANSTSLSSQQHAYWGF